LNRLRRGTATSIRLARTSCYWIESTASPAEKAAAFKDIEAVIPGLDALGLFEVMEVRDEGIREFIRERLAPNT